MKWITLSTCATQRTTPPTVFGFFESIVVTFSDNCRTVWVRLTTSMILFACPSPRAIPITSGLCLPTMPNVFRDLFNPIFEYLPNIDILPACIFDENLCKRLPCAFPMICVVPRAIFMPLQTAPLAPPINVPVTKPVHAPSIAPSSPPSIAPAIAPDAAPTAPPESAPVKAAPHTTAAAPPVQAVATANPAIATTPTATFIQLGIPHSPSSSTLFNGSLKQYAKVFGSRGSLVS